MVAYTFDPRTLEGKGRQISVSSRLVWSAEQVLGQAPELDREILSREEERDRKKETEKKRIQGLERWLSG